MREEVHDIVTREIVKVRIRGTIAKTGKRRITFISPEAKEAIEEWLTFRSQYLKQAIGRTAKERRGKDRTTLFPFTTANFNVIWKIALVKAKLSKIDEVTNRIHMRPHNLRKYFRLRVGRFGRDEAEALMGHQEGLNKVYARFEGEDGEKRLEEIYKKAIPELSIYERTVKTSQAQLEIQKENRQLRKDIEGLKGRNENLWNEVENLSKRVERFEAHVQRMIELEKRVDERLEEMNRIEWSKLRQVNREDLPEEMKKV